MIHHKRGWLWPALALLCGLLAAAGLNLHPQTAQGQQPMTPTPTSTRIFRLATEITAPLPEAVIFGMISVEGTAVVDSYRQYQLHISPSGLEEWSWLTSSYRVIREGQLYILDSTRLRDGFYDLRLRALRDNGQYQEALVRQIEIRNSDPPTPTPQLDPLGTPIPATSTPELTASPTPVDISSRIPGGQGFYAPANNSLLRDSVPIVATVNGSPFHYFDRYELYISAAGAEQWSWLYSDHTQLWQETIYVLETNPLADGFYDLRLRIVYRDSNYSEYHLRNLAVAHGAPPAAPGTELAGRPVAATVTTGAEIRSPRSQIAVSGRIGILGSATHPRFQRWELAWSQTGLERWALILEGERQVVNSLLAELDFGRMRPGLYDLRLRVVRDDGNYDEFVTRQIQVLGNLPAPQ